MVNKKYMPKITTVSDDNEKIDLTMRIVDENASLKEIRKAIRQACKSLKSIWLK